VRANFGPLFERLSIMKRIIGTAAGLCLLAASQVFAQTPEKKAVETTTKQTGPGPNLKTEAQSVSGTVREYERVEGVIVVGQMATVNYTKGTDGKETVVAVSEATANAVTAAGAPKMHSESTTKMSGATASTETKTEVVIGVVKEYEAGKSIKVTGPDSKDYSFDLTDMAPLKKAVTVGERVKVTFTKSDNGDKATTIVAHSGKV
jgi:hypothetical protein